MSTYNVLLNMMVRKTRYLLKCTNILLYKDISPEGFFIKLLCIRCISFSTNANFLNEISLQILKL